MNIAVVYPVPNESPEVWAIFKPFVERFVNTWKQFPPGVACTLCPVTFDPPAKATSSNKPSDEILSLFQGINTQFHNYPGKGMDLGAQQWVSLMGSHDFQVNFTSRAYFHRPGWLARMVAARHEYGPALYGMSASKEGGKFHICTRGHAYDREDFKLYHTMIESRNQGVFFECGDGCLTEFFWSIGRPAAIVRFDGHPVTFYSWEDAHYLKVENGFRNGDQSNMLAHDKHTDFYRDSDPETKERMANLMLGVDLSQKAA